MIIIEQESLLILTEKISKFLCQSGGQFGDSNITSQNNISKSMAESLPDIAEYCKKQSINMTEIDSIKLLVFAMPYLKKNDSSMNIERYIKSIFLLLENSYKVKINFKDIDSTIKVCTNIFYSDPSQLLVIYGYVKGFQECLKYTNK
jgi:hypothetical protein